MVSLRLVFSIDLLSLAMSSPHLGVALTLKLELGVYPLHLTKSLIPALILLTWKYLPKPGVDPLHLEVRPEACC
jgi:hypothetical protein